MKLSAALALLSSCGLQTATRIVWEDTYKATCLPPKIVIERTVKQCLSNGPPRVAVSLPDGRCVSGTYDGTTAVVSWPQGSPLHLTTFSHELLHAWQLCRGFYDDNHLSPEWPVLVPAGNKALTAEGW